MDAQQKSPSPMESRPEAEQVIGSHVGASPGDPRSGAGSLVGRRVGRIQVLELLGRGGMGEVGLNWVADRDFLALRDITGKARSFNYTLSVLHEDTKVYFDPELVNIGDTGGEPGYPPPEGYWKDRRAAASEN